MVLIGESFCANTAWLLRSPLLTAMTRTRPGVRAANTAGISLPEPRSSAPALIASMCCTPELNSFHSIW